MKRVLLFLGTNLVIVLLLSVTLRVLGVEPYLTEQGLNLGSLLVFAAVMGMGIKRLFMTHPPLAERIAALRRPE